jgi:hypothetical protein
MASAIVLLLYTDAPLRRARDQLGVGYGHLPLGRTGNIDRFFDLYEEWLARGGRQHSPAAFRRWAVDEYCPGECRCALELLEPRGRPAPVPLGRPFPLRVRCTNTSIKPWRLRPGNNAGIHAHWALCDEDGRPVTGGRAGLFHATVAPGASIDLTLAVRALWEPGRYCLRVDMFDEQHGGFLQMGSMPLFWEVEVR